MATLQRSAWGAIALQALAAGIAGGIAFELYVWLTSVLPSHASMVQFWQFVASAVVGNVAFTSTQYAWLGLAIHFAIGVGWAGGYAYFAAGQPATNRHWLVAGAAYGVVVYVLMQLILLADGKFTAPPTPGAFLNTVAAHVVFFGIPVAFVVRSFQPRRA